MVESLRENEINFLEKIKRYKKFAKADGESSGDIDALLAPGKIEELVREFRHLGGLA